MKIVIETSGGVVQAVHTSEPGVIVDLLDWDDVNDGAKISADEEAELLADTTKDTPHEATWVVDAPIQSGAVAPAPDSQNCDSATNRQHIENL